MQCKAINVCPHDLYPFKSLLNETWISLRNTHDHELAKIMSKWELAVLPWNHLGVERERLESPTISEERERDEVVDHHGLSQLTVLLNNSKPITTELGKLFSKPLFSSNGRSSRGVCSIQGAAMIAWNVTSVTTVTKPTTSGRPQLCIPNQPVHLRHRDRLLREESSNLQLSFVARPKGACAYP